jgi:uncharacterized protein (DUF2267 family)
MNQAIFISEVAQRLRCDGRRAEGVTFAVFQELRDRLTPKEAADVAAQLPRGLKQLWCEREQPGRAVERTHREEFIGRVRHWAGLPDDTEAERGVKAVFGALQKLLGSPNGREGEAWDVLSQLPKDMKKLWLSANEKQHL